MGKFSHGLVASLGICGRSMKLHLLEEGDGDRMEQRTDQVAGGCAGWLGDTQVCVRQFPLGYTANNPTCKAISDIVTLENLV